MDLQLLQLFPENMCCGAKKGLPYHITNKVDLEKKKLYIGEKTDRYSYLESFEFIDLPAAIMHTTLN